MDTPAKSLAHFLIAVAALVLLAAVLNFVVDPLQLFRPAQFYRPMYSNDSRMQNAGLIRSQSFDTVFMGTSLAIHFRQSDIDRVIGGRSLKLSMSGSTSHEQSFVLAAALERHPRRVIWQMDDWIFRDAPEVDSDIYLPVDLYRRNLKGIAEYLFSGATACESLFMLAHSTPPLERTMARLASFFAVTFPIDNPDQINVLEADFTVGDHYNAGRAMAAFADDTSPERRASLADGYQYDSMVRNFERDTVELINRNPNTRFDIYFPPYSILQFVAMRDSSPTTLKIVYDFTAYISQRLAQLPNVSLYDFRIAKEVTHNLNNYADTVHHSPEVDLKILSWIAERKFVVDRATPLTSLNQLKAQTEAYSVVR